MTHVHKDSGGGDGFQGMQSRVFGVGNSESKVSEGSKAAPKHLSSHSQFHSVHDSTAANQAFHSHPIKVQVSIVCLLLRAEVQPESHHNSPYICPGSRWLPA